MELDPSAIVEYELEKMRNEPLETKGGCGCLSLSSILWFVVGLVAFRLMAEIIGLLLN